MKKLISVFLIVTLFLSCSAFKKDKSATTRPNIVYILADDMGQGDLSCYNKASKINTPSMDKLAADGMLFTDFHTNSAVCTPTRYGILTGRYSFRTRLKRGVLHTTDHSLIKKDEPTVATLAKSYGYNTACIGKWHLGMNWQFKEGVKESKGKNRIMGNSVDYTKPYTFGPNEVGFDYFYGITASLDMPPYVFLENHSVVKEPTKIMFSSSDVATDHGRTGYGDPDFVLEDVLPQLTEKAVAYIDKQNKNIPFFLYFPLNAPHTPIVPTKEFLGKSGAGIYGDFVLEVDWVVGQVVKTLKAKGLYDNTIIVLTSDNGTSPHSFPIDRELKFDHNTSNNYKGRKSHTYEGGHRVPFIVSWPEKIKAGTTSDEIICSTDLYATVASILGHDLQNKEGVDSYSMLPILSGEITNRPLREATVHHSLGGVFSIRKGNWKYIDGKGHGGFGKSLIKEEFSKEPVQLYDIKNDTYETVNVYKENPKIVTELKALLEKYKEQGYSRPIK